MIPNPYDIKYFHVVAETLNLSRAAERLGVVQPTLSGALKRLEDSIGKPLFIREKSGLSLTRAGEEFLKGSKSLFDSWEKLSSNISQLDMTPSGRYTLGLHPSIALYSLRPIMSELVKYKEIEINFSHGLSREILEMVVSRKVDVGLVINPIKHNDLVLKRICTDRVGLWASSGSADDVLIYDPSLTQSQALMKKMEGYKKHMTSSNLEVIGELIQTGCGVGILPERVAKRFKGLKPVSDKWFVDELYLVYRADQSRTAGFKVIIDTILKADI